MLINKKFRATLVMFILLFSFFSSGITFIEYGKAQEESDIFKDFLDLMDDNVLFPHPFRIAGVWVYNGNETTVEGDVTFDLYFSSTLAEMLNLENYKDKVNISIYKLSNQSETPVKIENGYKVITLEPELSEGKVQKTRITVENINVTLDDGDSLVFVIELLQSEKLLSNYAAKQYEKIKSKLKRIGDKLNSSKNPQLKDVGTAIDMIMEELEYYNIKGDDFGSLVNVFVSSAFYYGCDSYNSSISFSTNSSKNYTLYFQNEVYPEYDDYGFVKIVNETDPKNDTIRVFPPIVNLGGITDAANSDEWLTWFMVWLMYNMGEPPVEEENRVTYYLHQNEVMDETKPDSSNKVIRSKLSTEPIEFKGHGFSRNKILKNITANLYIYYPKILSFGKVSINVSLYNGDKKIATDEKQLDRTTLFELLKRGPDTPTTFNFETYKGNEEIIHDQNITLKVSISNKPKLSLRPVNLLYDSNVYDSSVTLVFNETNNIKIGDIEDKEVYAGGSAEFNVKITSKYADEIKIKVEGDQPDWTIEYPEKIRIGANETETVKIFVNSTATDSSVYGEINNLFFNVSGKTGIDSKKATVTITEDAVKCDFEIIPQPESLEIKHGENKTYSFIVRNRNTGYLEDTYSIEKIESEHNFSIEYTEPFTINELLDVYNNDTKAEIVFNVTVYIPKYTTITSDKLTVTLASHKNSSVTKTVTVTTKIITPNILESIYHIFENMAKRIGFSSIFGGYAAALLIIIVAAILWIIIMIIIVIIRRKFVELICLDRIKEITPDETAVYTITLRNPYKRAQSYEIKTHINGDPKKWDVSVDYDKLTIDSKQSKDIKLSVKPTDFVKSDDWVEVKVIARPLDKVKTYEISTMTSIKDSKTKLNITGVVHWPKVFKKGDKVETSFKLVNRGNVAAENVTVILYVNGKEKNRVENITIPRGGYADIEIPWIAEKGKNEVNIVVK